MLFVFHIARRVWVHVGPKHCEPAVTASVCPPVHLTCEEATEPIKLPHVITEPIAPSLQ